MEKFNITFWKKPYNANNSFVRDTDAFKTSATITHFKVKKDETFHVKLNDIGLNSLYGEFDILRQNGFWHTSDQDSDEINQLKNEIIEVLMNQLK